MSTLTLGFSVIILPLLHACLCRFLHGKFAFQVSIPLLSTKKAVRDFLAGVACLLGAYEVSINVAHALTKGGAGKNGSTVAVRTNKRDASC